MTSFVRLLSQRTENLLECAQDKTCREISRGKNKEGYKLDFEGLNIVVATSRYEGVLKRLHFFKVFRMTNQKHKKRQIGSPSFISSVVLPLFSINNFISFNKSIHSFKPPTDINILQ